MDYVPINIARNLERFADHWSPKVIAEMNDYQFKLVKLQGEFVWHAHSDTDEVFIVIKGRMSIKFRDGAVKLDQGEMYVVAKGVEHKPVANEECHVLLIEPRGVVNTGDRNCSLTAENDVWI